jgi:hypothetical protein
LGGGDDEELQATVIETNIKKKLKVNLDQVIKDVQVEPIEYVTIVTIEVRKLVVVSIEVSQLVQLVIEPSNLENPLFSTFQSTLISSNSYENLKYIIMFFEQVVHNVTTQSRILDGLTNLNVECQDSRGQIKFV